MKIDRIQGLNFKALYVSRNNYSNEQQKIIERLKNEFFVVHYLLQQMVMECLYNHFYSETLDISFFPPDYFNKLKAVPFSLIDFYLFFWHINQL